ncbi:hypothetical protein [Rhodanobacter spathiphylli]|uniref:hypothetical protein n=1 Tax=Rhodanobacter spathiphylli TaxID=347483 RepID=UPI0012FB65A2|nr:hypothetical protein [Rhodanobacter spathiphylli]
MFHIAFVSIALAGVFYFLRRPLGAFPLGYFSSLIWFVPAFFPTYPIDDEAYFYYLACLIAIVAGDVLFGWRRKNKSVSQTGRKDVASWSAILATFVVLGALYLPSVSITSLALGKANDQAGGVVYYSFATSLSFLAVAGLYFRKRWALAVAAMCYAEILLSGDRTQIVLTAIASAIFLSSGKCISPLSLVRRLRFAWLAAFILLAIVGIYGKTIYGAFFDSLNGATFSSAIEHRYSSSESFADKFEPYHTQMIMQLAVSRGDRISPDYLLSVPLQFLPWSGSLGGDVHAQSEMLKKMYFSGWSDSSGVASNFLAEGYLVGGTAGVTFFIFLYVFGLAIFSKMLSLTTALIPRIGSSLGAAFWAFYIHRCSLLQMIGHEKRVVYFSLFLVIVCAMFLIMRRSFGGAGSRSDDGRDG